ncbi:MAG TPA: hypothetical protein VIL46_15690 [Gemmataceae bacterium]
MFWTRELVGWVLIGLGVAVFGVCYFEFLRYRRVFEAGPAVFMGFILFRGGIHLLKVAVAARVCGQAAAGAPEPRPAGGNGAARRQPGAGGRGDVRPSPTPWR